jgi:hypothetical protein
MSRPPLEVADLIRAAGTLFSNEIATGSAGSTSKCCGPFARCRTAALGGHLDQCTRCGHRHHLLQLLPQPALPEVSDRRSGTVDRRASKRTSPDALRPCGLHAASVS